MPSIDWLPWATPAFQRAQQARRPVLLLLDVAWSAPCRSFAATTLAQPEIVDLVEKAYVPVHVDADWRPDIADRYGLGAWPVLLALTPDGHVLAGGTPADVDLHGWLARVDERFRQHGGRWPAPAAPTHATAADVSALTAIDPLRIQLQAAVDPESGAFGAGTQPTLAPALAGLALTASDLDTSLADAAVTTIDRLLGSHRWDPARGLLLCRGTSALDADAGCARLGTQAEWVRLLAHAVACDARPSWRDALLAAVGGLRATMQSSTSVIFVDATARACRALLAAAQVLDDEGPAATAIDALEAMLPRAYTRGAGVAHVLTTRAHGPALLADAMLVAHALLDANPWRGQPVYRDLAEELVRSALSRLQHASGALLDRRSTMAGANAVGRLAEPVTPLEGNADAARACVRLGPDDAWWTGHARQLLAGVHREASGAGGFAAPVVLAWAALEAPDHPISVW